MLTVKVYNIIPFRDNQRKSFVQDQNQNRNQKYSQSYHNSPPWKGLNSAIAANDLSACLEIIEAVSPASDPIEFLNHFNPRFACPRCGRDAEIIERNRRYLKLRCPKCGCFLKWLGGGRDA